MVSSSGAPHLVLEAAPHIRLHAGVEQLAPLGRALVPRLEGSGCLVEIRVGIRLRLRLRLRQRGRGRIS